MTSKRATAGQCQRHQEWMFSGLVGSNRGQEHLNSPTCIAECMQLDFWFWSSQSLWKCWIGWQDTQFSSIQLLNRTWLSATPWTAECQASLSITSSWSLLKPMSIESMMPSNHLILCHPLLLLPSIFPSMRVFSNESALCIRWPKYWSFSFNISPSNEYSGLISFRVDPWDLLAVQGTLKSGLQHHSSKASILWTLRELITG